MGVARELLRQLPLLEGLGPDDLAIVAAHVSRLELERGETLLVEGEPNDRLISVVSGRLKVWRRGGVEEIVLAEVGPGEVLGELTVLEPGPASANVTALEPSILVALAGRDLERLEAARPRAAATIYRRLALMLAHRVAQANRLVEAYHGLQETLLEIGRLRDRFEPGL